MEDFTSGDGALRAGGLVYVATSQTEHGRGRPLYIPSHTVPTISILVTSYVPLAIKQCGPFQNTRPIVILFTILVSCKTVLISDRFIKLITLYVGHNGVDLRLSA